MEMIIELMKCKEMVYELIRKFQTSDPFKLCHLMGITVVFAHLSGVRGFYQRGDFGDMIYIDQSITIEEQSFVCAHELGHALLDSGTNAIFLNRHTYQVIGKYERLADRFAVMLLWPDDNELMEYADLTLEQLSHLMGISEELVDWRYQQIGQI